MRKSVQRAFTLMELLIVVAIVAVLVLAVGVLGIGVIASGNEWYGEESAMRQLTAEQPTVDKLIKTERNVFAYSVFYVVNKDGKSEQWCLDSNVLFNYEFAKCSL